MKLNKKHKLIINILKLTGRKNGRDIIGLLGTQYSKDLRELVENGLIEIDAKWRLVLTKHAKDKA